VPLAVWGLVRGWRRAGTAAVAALALAAAGWTWQRAGTLAGVERPLAQQAPAGQAGPPEAHRPGRLAPASCERPPDQVATAFLTSPAAVACVQAEGAEALRGRVLERAAALGRPLAVDEVVAVAPLGGLPLEVLDGLLVRPAVDGVCAGTRCLLPWQLVAADAFGAATPLASVPDLRFGVSRAALAARLGGPPVLRFATRSTVLAADGTALALDRGRKTSPPPEAAAAAERYVLASQQPDGKFAYTLDPFTGVASMRGYGVPRQAGTTLVLCELGSPAAAAAARRSLEVLVAETSRAPATGVWRLGPTALALAALATCRPRVGAAFDGDIATLTDRLLAMARPDGRFHHRVDAASGAPLPGPDALYASGQAVLALALVEGQGGAPAVRDAVERAMSYTARDYWPSLLRGFFFLEENWHCLAARAALPHHRHDGYERFCLEYVASKRRFLVPGGPHAGGLGFGNLVPPQATPTAGHAEALAAAIALRLARGEDAAAERADLRRALAFVVRHQWQGPECFACAAPDRVVGGVSESVAAPLIRIDYVQHAWAALGHGERVLR
jgi:hypothetical protein